MKAIYFTSFYFRILNSVHEICKNKNLTKMSTCTVFNNWVDLHTCQITTALNTGFYLTANLLNIPRTLLTCGSSCLTMHTTVWTEMFLCHSVRISISLERLNQSSPFFHRCKGKSMTYLNIDIIFSKFLFFLKYSPHPMIVFFFTHPVCCCQPLIAQYTWYSVCCYTLDSTVYVVHFVLLSTSDSTVCMVQCVLLSTPDSTVCMLQCVLLSTPDSTVCMIQCVLLFTSDSTVCMVKCVLLSTPGSTVYMVQCVAIYPW